MTSCISLLVSSSDNCFFCVIEFVLQCVQFIKHGTTRFCIFFHRCQFETYCQSVQICCVAPSSYSSARFSMSLLAPLSTHFQRLQSANGFSFVLNNTIFPIFKIFLHTVCSSVLALVPCHFV